jgi:hypothetical protein
MLDNWSLWLENRQHCFPHHENCVDLDNTASSNCSLCYQFRSNTNLDSNWYLARTAISGHISVEEHGPFTLMQRGYHLELLFQPTMLSHSIYSGSLSMM